MTDHGTAEQDSALRRIDIVQQDITTLEVDAIQNAANGMLVHGAGVAGAIARAGGPRIQAESHATVLTTGVLEEGRATWTTGGDLPARYVIHAVTMRFPGGRTRPYVAHDATRNTLNVATALHCESVALVALGTGIGRLSLDECARAMVGAVEFVDPTMSVVFAVSGDDAEQAFAQAIDQAVRNELR